MTLTTWRWARRTLGGKLSPMDVLPWVAVETVRVLLDDVPEPIALFARHARATPEFVLVTGLVTDPALRLDVLDAGFLLRWEELVADGAGPEELPPLRRRAEVRLERQ